MLVRKEPDGIRKLQVATQRQQLKVQKAPHDVTEWVRELTSSSRGMVPWDCKGR